ncbi:transposase [Natribaculum luteum]|uniref:Transposase n=1 Tax=Natribaculum luteum TaxID=1586232 RepID=A0ABD5P279_9EURY|nr:transposase [Natribaculum luteum]
MTNNWSDRVAAADDSRTQRSVDERLQDIGPLSGGWLPLTKQAAEVVDKTTSAAELVTHLDVSQYCRADSIPHWHDSKPFEPMLRAILLKKLEDASDGWLHRTLDSDPQLADALGFNPDDTPSRSTISRAQTNRFADLQSTIETATRQIQALAAERGSPIGTPYEDSASEEPTGSSKRTVNRLIRRKTRDLLDELQTVVLPAFEFDRPDDPVYDDEELLMLEACLGLTGTAANGGAETYGDFVNPDPDLDDPFYEDGPSGETLLEAIKDLSPTQIAEMVNQSAARVLTRAKPRLEFETPVMLSIDMTYVAFYGEREELVRVQGAPKDKSYNWCYKFATANVVGDNVHFAAAMLPVGHADYHDPESYPGKNRSYRVGDIVRRLVDHVNDVCRVHTRRLYADREFYATDVFSVLEQRDLFYVIPAPRDDRVKRFIARMDTDVEGQKQVTVKSEHAVYGPVKHGVSNTRAETTLVGLPPDEDCDEMQVFSTNLDVNDEIGLDRRLTKKQITRYRRRGGIETAYSKIKEFAPWTTSTNFSIRLFHFGFAVLLYDLWLLVDFLVQTLIDIIEFRTKPRVTAPRFRAFLRREVSALL